MAHGIASSLDGKRAVIGSEHFVMEDEGAVVGDEQRERIARELAGLRSCTWRSTGSWSVG